MTGNGQTKGQPADTSAADGRLIAIVEKNAVEQIRVRLTEYRGYELVDIRLFYSGGAGEFRPTSKGITLRRSRLSELTQALQEAERIITDEQENNGTVQT